MYAPIVGQGSVHLDCALALLFIATVSFGCTQTGGDDDAASDAVAPVDAVEGRCVWSSFRRAPDPCDGMSRGRCADLALMATRGTTLVPYMNCVGSMGCVWGDACDAASCTCGGRTCVDGEICARRADQATAECVRCDLPDS